MPKFKIKKGTHRAKPLRFGLWYKRKKIEREVIFHRSSRYFLSGPDEHDVNKLYGLGFFNFKQIFSVLKGLFSQKYIPDILHHTDSARIGWNYNTDSDKMILYGYSYLAGERVIEEILRVPLETKIYTKIEVLNNGYQMTVGYNSIINTIDLIAEVPHNKQWSYYLSLYFGGTSTPSNDLEITINKI